MSRLAKRSRRPWSNMDEHFRTIRMIRTYFLYLMYRIAPKKQFVVHLVFLSSYLSDGLPIGLSYKCRIEYIPIWTYMQLLDTHTPT